MAATAKQREYLDEHLQADGYADKGVLTDSGRELPGVKTKRISGGKVARLCEELSPEEASGIIREIWSRREREGRDPDTGRARDDQGDPAAE